MDCYFSIKLPNGGEALIPAGLAKIENDEYFESLFDEYKKLEESGTEEDLDKITELKGKIRDLNKSGLHHSTVNKNLEKAQSADQFVELINEDVENKLNNTNIDQALFAFLKDSDFYKRGKYTPVTTIDKNGNKKDITLDAFYKLVSNPVKKNYFNKIRLENLLGIATVEEALIEIRKNLGQQSSLQMSTDALQHLHNLIDKVFPGVNAKRNKIFYNATFQDKENASVVSIDESTGLPIIFYNDSSELSLFLGVFSYAATKINKEDLVKVLEEFNSKGSGEEDRIPNPESIDVQEFFLGKMTDAGYIEPEFKKMLSVKYGIDSVFKIISLTADTFEFEGRTAEGNKARFIKGIQTLFGHIRPNTIGIGLFGNKQMYLTIAERERQENIQRKDLQIKEYFKDLISTENINYHYSPKVEIDTSDVDTLQEAILTNVELNRDVLIIPGRRAIIPTYIEKTSRGLLIAGFYSDGTKAVNIGKVGQMVAIKKGSKVSYRKLENIERIDYDTDITKEEATPLSMQFPDEELMQVQVKEISKIDNTESSELLPSEFIKSLVRRGSKIKYTYWSKKQGKLAEATGTVRAVFPGEIRLNKIKGNSYPVKYKNIIHFETLLSDVSDDFTDQEWEQKKELLTSLQRLVKYKNNILPIKAGDYVRLTHDKKTRYNKVMAVSKTHVFVMVKSSMKNDPNKTVHNIVAYPKEQITELFTEKLSEFEMDEAKKIFDEYVSIFKDEQSIRKANYSYFTNYETAMNGDYFVLPNAEGGGNIYRIVDKENRYAIGFGDKINNYITLSDKDIKNVSVLMTERDISSIDSIEIANINNFHLVTGDSPDDPYLKKRYGYMFRNGYTLTPASYVVPLDKNVDMALMRSGNLNVGSVRFGPKVGTVEKGFEDVTEELIQEINQNLDYRGSKLYVFQKGDGYIKRYNQSLQEYILQDEDGNPKQKESYPDKYIDVLAPNVFLGYVKEWKGQKAQFSNKMYKVVSIDGDTMILEYSGINNDGKTITIKRKESIKDAFEQKKFKVMYIRRTSDLNDRLLNSLEQHEAEGEQLERGELISRVASKLKTIFNIETQIKNIDMELEENQKYSGKKAWIEPGDTPESVPRVVFNLGNNTSSEADVLHEYIHLVLISLRYGDSRNSALYEQILTNYKNQKGLKNKSDNLFDLEESLVNEISKKIVNKGYVDAEEDFRQLLTNGIVRGLEKYLDGGTSIT